MIGVVGNDDPRATGGRAGDAEGEVVRLGPGAGEHHVAEVGREEGEKTLGIGEDAVVQVAGVGGKGGGLLRQGFHHPGVAMADGGDVVVAVEVGVAVWVVEVDALAADQMHRRLVEQAIGRA